MVDPKHITNDAINNNIMARTPLGLKKQKRINDAQIDYLILGAIVF